MSKNNTCPICKEKFKDIDCIIEHIQEEHEDAIPKDMTPERALYYFNTGRSVGSCVMCKGPTTFNYTTNKYNRFCDNPKCKEEYREMFKDRMKKVHGKEHLMADPDYQRKLLEHRKISGTYKFRDGTEFKYIGSYELDFLRFLDVDMKFDSSDILTPSPNTYKYKYVNSNDKENNGDKFYIPDMYIPSLNLEIEIKDGGNNPNNHPKIVKIDRVKEACKDKAMTSIKKDHYIKVVNKEYNGFIERLNQLKKET